MTGLDLIEADWPAPPNVRAVATTRAGGVSVGEFASLNLGSHVGDDAQAVSENRLRLRTALELPRDPAWLNQVHGNVVVEAAAHDAPPTADASFSRSPGQACVVLTADCLPVLLCDRDGTRVAAAHAGWRGLVGGVVETALRAMAVPSSRVIAWLGPAIEKDMFEVGPEVREQFVERSADNARSFVQNARGRWQADLYDLARRELARLGVAQVFGGGFRCYADRDRFYSFRRDGKTGRMATLVWMK
ncbi:MAG TPA: peptidoglycan editing factor PgeF [Steroidobacteraceae bacterium]|nr:peptidoglycan editing factor PgeF [Steroidobacteraceae bacterium]